MNKVSPLLRIGLVLLLPLLMVAASSCQAKGVSQPQARGPSPAQPAQEVAPSTPAPQPTPVKPQPEPTPPAVITPPPTAAPSGPKIAFGSDRDGNWEIYTMNLDGTGPANLTRHAASDRWPAYSPDGKKIAFTSNRSGNWDIFVMNADGTGVVRLTNDPASDVTPTWSPDGKRIAFASRRNGGQHRVFIMNADGTGVTQVRQPVSQDLYPRWSPAGDEIAFISTDQRTGNFGVFIMDLEGRVLKTVMLIPYRLGSDEVTYPMAWSPDASKIAYLFFNSATTLNGVYFSAREGPPDKTLVWERATTRSVTGYAVNIHSLAWSSDGKQTAFGSTHEGGRQNIYIVNLDGSGLVDLTKGNGTSAYPSFSPGP